MATKEQIIREVRGMADSDLEELAGYLRFLRLRSRERAASRIDESELAALYSEFDTDDRELAEAGIDDYHKALLAEDLR